MVYKYKNRIETGIFTIDHVGCYERLITESNLR